MGVILSIIISLVVAAIVLLIVDGLNLGLSVDGFGSAVIAALVIAVVGGVVLWLLGVLGIAIGGGWVGALVYLVVAAIVLMISGGILPGLAVSGFLGAIVAAIGIGVVNWLVIWILSLLGLTFV